MTDFENGPFVYDDYISTVSNQNPEIQRKMYNRGPIMTTSERNELESWAIALLTSNTMTTSENKIKLKVLSENDGHIIPLIFELKRRVEEKERLTGFKKETSVKDNLIIVPKGGFLHKHTDPNDLQNNLFHIRFNIFISVNQTDFNAYYDGHVVDAVDGCYVLCRSGIDSHWSDINESEIPRISLSFGYLLPLEKIDELTSNPLIGTYSQYYPLSIHKPLTVATLHSITKKEESMIIEERGEPGSCIFTISDVVGPAQCDYLVHYINKHSELWQERDLGYKSGNNAQCKFLLVKHMVSLNVPDSYAIDEFIFKVVGVLLKKIRSLYLDFKGVQDDGYTLRKFFGGTKLHTDGIHSKSGGFTNAVRCLSLIIVLNDDYDGGIFNFPNQGIKFKVKKGEAVMFPPYWTHPHSVTSVGEGQARYAINTWVLEKFID